MRSEQQSLLPIAAKLFVPLQVLFAFYLMLRGHNLPGGGFIGGLVLASAIVLSVMVNPSGRRWEPLTLAGGGLLIAIVSALLPLAYKLPFFSGIWWGSIWLPAVGKTKLGTPLTFDIGVYMVVTGIAAKLLLVLLTLLNQNQDSKKRNLT